MKISIGSTKIFYLLEGDGAPVVLLHGWGGSHKLMVPLQKRLVKAGRRVLCIDLMGFGDSPPPPAHFSTDDYADVVAELMDKLGLAGATVVGHSFGGRIALILGARGRAEKLVLMSSAGLKPRFSLGKWLKIRKYKRAKRKGRDVSGFGSSDYRAINGAMRQVFVRVVNRHLDELLPKISVPVLLLWGKKDTETPPYMAKKMVKSMADAGLVQLNGGHFAYLENIEIVTAAITKFSAVNLPKKQ